MSSATVIRRILQVLLPVLVLGLAGGVMVALIKSRPTASRKAAQPLAPVVEVLTLTAGEERADVEAHGAVIAAREVTIQAQVSGLLTALAPELVEGGRFEAGQVLVEVDPRDYELAVAEREGQLARAQLDLAVELGRKDIAEREWELLQRSGRGAAEDSALALREPHIASARAAVAAAESQLARARLDLERATITAPFNALVLTESAELGQLVTPQTQLARLVGTDRFYVRVAVPVTQLRLIPLPEPGELGAEATVSLDLGGGRVARRRGRIARLLGDLEPSGRMARLLIAIDDPLGLRVSDELAPPAPLFLGAFVKVELHGRSFDAAFRIPRRALRGDDTVWRLSAAGTLELVTVETPWRGEEEVVVTEGLRSGDRIITSRLATPVAGMALRVQGEAP